MSPASEINVNTLERDPVLGDKERKELRDRLVILHADLASVSVLFFSSFYALEEVWKLPVWMREEVVNGRREKKRRKEKLIVRYYGSKSSDSYST